MRKRVIQQLLFMACFFAAYIIIILIINMIIMEELSVTLAFSEITLNSYIVGMGVAIVMSFVNFGKRDK